MKWKEKTEEKLIHNRQKELDFILLNSMEILGEEVPKVEVERRNEFGKNCGFPVTQLEIMMVWV